MIKSKTLAFTLAEILITLGVIGIVAALTIPNLIYKAKSIQYRIAYKKAYADLTQAVKMAIESGEIKDRNGNYDAAATDSEWEIVFKNGLKGVSYCGKNTSYPVNACWADGEMLYGEFPRREVRTESSMIDLSGRSWATYYYQSNLYLVDTNGLSKPNQYGKDRWIFQLARHDIMGIRVTPSPNRDVLTIDTNYCNYPPCYFKSWLK